MGKDSNGARNDIAVIGLSGRFPGAGDVATFWRNIAGGVESTRALSDDDLTAAGIDPAVWRRSDYVRRTSPLENVESFDAAFFDFTAREASMTAPSQRLLLMCAYEALEDACCLPQVYQGNIGVFVGANRCDEWQKRLYELSEQMTGQTAKQLQFFIASDLDYSATRISYKLNLTGPSMSISTACSTSLVAISQACRSLLTYECDLALAGGGNVVVPQDAGYVYEEGGIRSSDGHCRAFDAKADGTIFGNGAGVVVLKRLGEALANRDHIDAVIRGAAINNDGSAKVGYTAPSVTGQSQVIASAMALAGTQPEHIGYVEAHGTGTPLGDPIEIEALTKAYRAKTRKKRYCAIGSVKTNIGHLGSAAGVAGFIKAVQALKHRQLPPSLHFERPNPEIDFAGSPFFVNTGLKDWPSAGAPRRAAVSSFGVGGTNAHVILEEAPPVPASGASRPQQLLTLSAKTPTALAALSRRLAERLESEPSANLADVAHSLNRGRYAFAHRRASVAADLSQAVAALRDDAAPADRVENADARSGVAFMFPGQGAQHVRMTFGLYQNEKLFRDIVDDCAQRLQPLLQLDLRSMLFPPQEDEEAAEQQLRQTRLAQPALFVVEYALARLWQSWGVNPDRMIGHSIGEYAAACLAGVFSLPDALELVAERGRLMQRMPVGAMLAVSLSETELQPLLGECELAAVNGPAWCVACGTDAEVRTLEARLQERGVSYRPLHTSHAFHSRMMEPMLQDYARAVSAVKLQAPKISFLSNLTGDWIKNHQATDPAYWVKQLRATVQFYPGVRRLLDAGRTLLLEVGPGQTLTALTKTFLDAGGSHRVVASCRQVKQAQDDQAVLLHAVGRAWMAGIELDWNGYYAGESRNYVSLPTYPFEGKRYWLERRRERTQGPQTVSVLDGQEAEATEGVAANVTKDLRSRLRAALPAQRLDILKSFVRQSVRLLLGTQELPDNVALIELGMSSLSAIELRTQFNTVLGADCVSVVTLLEESATIEHLAAVLEEAFNNGPQVDALPVNDAATAPAARAVAAEPAADPAAVEFPSSTLTIRPDADNQYQPFPLTDIQQAYWIGRHGVGEGDGVATYGYVETDVHHLDVERYQTALNTLIQRHHMLRMVVREDGSQQFLRDVPFYHIPYEDLTRDTDAQCQAKLEQVRATMSHQILDPAIWPLFQIRIHRIAPDVYRIHFGFDFLIVDVLSLLVFFRDQFLIYAGEGKRLPPLEINFRDYVMVEKAGKESAPYQRAKRYWLDRAATLPAAPLLPFTKEAAQITAPRYARRDFSLDADTWCRLKDHARRYRITPSVLIATAYAEVLAQWSKLPSFTINLTIFNRPRLHPQMNDLIGDFTSSVLLATDMSERGSFERGARRLQTQLLNDLEHRQFTGVEMLRAMNSQMGGYQAVVMPIVLTSALGLDQYTESRLAGMSPEQLRTYDEMMNPAYAVSQTSQVWLDHVVREKDGVLLCNWDALEELYPPGVLDAMFCAYYDRLIALANEGDAAWQQAHVARLPAAQLARRQQVNATDGPVSTQLLQQAFAQTALARPDNVAVINRGMRLSYRDLHVLATQFGAQLRAAGVKPNQLVAVVMHKGWEQIVAVFATLFSGAAYMPIDGALPRERIRQLLVQGEVTFAFTQDFVAGEVDWPAGVQPIVIESRQIERNRQRQAVPVELAAVQAPTDLAYVLFTSGSTGAPKGVMIDHESALNTVLDVNVRFAITERDRAIAINALNFDLSVYDIFGLLSVGGALVMPDHARALDPHHWSELVVEEGVTFWNTVPAIVQLYIEELESSCPAAPQAGNGLRWIFMSGDWVPVNLPDRIRRAIPTAQPVSLGGPTETTVWSIFHPIGKVEPEWKSIPYGKPLTHRTHRILHADLTDCPEWVPGEIHTGGRVGLSRGYWKDEDKTNAVFIRHPDTGERLYRTGDWGRFLPDGNIEFLGREDKQVKVQGHRIELGEIEFALRQCEDVQDAVVLAVRDAAGAPSNMRLVGYVVERGQSEDRAALRAFKSSEVLTDPLEIAAFKMSQAGLRRFDASAPRVGLPAAPAPDRTLALGRALDHGALVDAPIALERWGRWLSCLGQVRLEGYGLPKYYYPSAGSSYAVQTYIYLRPNAVQSLDAGLYYYDPQHHQLIRLAAEEAKLERLFADVPAGRFALLMMSNDRAIAPLYGRSVVERCYGLEAGHIEQLLRAAGCAQDIGLADGNGMDAESLRSILVLDTEHQFIKCMVGGALVPRKDAAGLPELNVVARQTYRRFLRRPIAGERFDALLAHWTPAAAECAGNGQPSVYIYMKPKRVAGLDGGLYQYDFAAGRLTLLRPFEAVIDNLQYTRNRKLHHASAFSILFARPKNCPAAEGLQSLVHAGYLAQALGNVASSLEIGLCSTGGIKADAVAPYLPALAESEVIYCLECGAIEPEQTRTWITESMQQDVQREWHDALRDSLPYYMVPSSFVRLESFPLTANGKVDRKALAAMATAAPAKERKIVAARDTIETALIGIWQQVLAVDAVSVEDNLFELGGDSLTATKLLSETGKVLGVNIPLHKLFADPTLAGMAQICRAALADNPASGAAKADEPFARSDEVIACLKTDAVLDPAIQPEASLPPNVQSPRHVLLTGATGFLGAYVLRELLQTTAADIHCLVRPGKRGDEKQRIVDNLRKYGLWDQNFHERVIAVKGDLSAERFIADKWRDDFLSTTIDVIYHVGAQVNYARGYADLKRTNVDGAVSLIRFACRKRLKAVNFVSTKYVCFGLGERGLELFGEETSMRDPSGLFIGYTQSKWVAEQLFEQARERGVPVTIVRPGQLTAAANGKTVLPDDAFHHLVRMFLALRARPNRGEWEEGAIDIVPADYAARAIVAIGSRPASCGKHFHLVNDRPMSMDRFFDTLEGGQGSFAAAPFAQWAEDCRAHVAALEDRTVAYVLEKFFVQTPHGHSIRGLFVNGEFSTTNLAAALAEHGVGELPADELLWRRYLARLTGEGSRLETETEESDDDRNMRRDFQGRYAASPSGIQ